jgi:hypothetical protein
MQPLVIFDAQARARLAYVLTPFSDTLASFIAAIISPLALLEAFLLFRRPFTLNITLLFTLPIRPRAFLLRATTHRRSSTSAPSHLGLPGAAQSAGRRLIPEIFCL